MKAYKWVLEVVFYIAMIVIVPWGLKVLFSKVKKKMDLKENDAGYLLEDAIAIPLKIIAGIFLGAFLFDLLVKYFGIEEKVFSIIPLRNAAVIACLTWSALRWKKIFRRAAIARGQMGKPSLRLESIELLDKFFTVFVVFISLLFILQIFGFNIAPLVTFGGIGAAALGFASKDIITNLYGGLMIHMTRPFTINDMIDLPQKKILGSVEEIGWYFTTIRNAEKRPVYVPNSIFSTEYLTNISRMTHYCIEEKISFHVDDLGKVETLVDKVRRLLASHPGIDSSQGIEVYITTLNERSIGLNMKVYAFVTPYEKFIKIKESILLKIGRLSEEAGAGIQV